LSNARCLREMHLIGTNGYSTKHTTKAKTQYDQGPDCEKGGLLASNKPNST